MCQIFKIFFILLLAFVSSSDSDQIYPQILVDLDNVQPGETVTQFYNVTDPKYSINVIHINNSVSFFVIQVHTFNENVTLSYKDLLETQSFTTGTNIGLVWTNDVSNGVTEFYLFRDPNLAGEVNVLLVINTYTKDDPVPGGCNLSFETELAPYQKVNQTDEVITVMSQPPSVFGEFCDQSNISTEMYYLFLNEYDKSSDGYFLEIQNMITAENVTKYGTKVPKDLARIKFKQMYNKYTGTGRIFAVVSTHNGRTSTYVPAVSFGCNLNAWDEDCVGPIGVHWRVAIALLLICGLFLCLVGHRFFRTGLFLVSYTFGVILMLIVVTIDNDFTAEGKEVYSLIVGVFIAITWVFLWWKFGVPVIAVQLAFLLAALVFASILFYTQLGTIYIFTDDVSFWATFGFILIMSQIPLMYLRPLFHIIALSLVGSYAAIVAMNYYVGGNLQYILINTYRRMTVKDFGMVVLDPPYQILDICQTILWVLVFGCGIYIQHKHSLGKPPFPPNRSGVEVSSLNERTPLLLPEHPPAYMP